MKVLVIRFSSFGDVLQSLSIAGHIKNHWPQAQIHFLTRADFAPLVENHPSIDRVWRFEKAKGLAALLEMVAQLRQQPWTHVYDSHNNLRSRLVCLGLVGPFGILGRLRGVRFLRRSIKRWKRFLLFRLRLNYFEMPFSGQRDLLKPLEAWGMPFTLPPTPQIVLPAKTEPSVALPEQFIALAPSAAHKLKRWPLEHWQNLIQLMPDCNFVALGGPEDTFIAELVKIAPERVLNLAGKLSLLESSQVVLKSDLLISNDTGLMHVAEQTGHPCVALMGPAPFGFPSRPSTKILQLDLPCRPCSKHGQGPCFNQNKYHQCLVDITPARVKHATEVLMGGRD